MSQAIVDVRALEVLDSRGNPTIAVRVDIEGGASGTAMAPSGASTGSREAYELRDQEPDRYLGRGVRKAVSHANSTIREALLGYDSADQRAIDNRLIELDGSADKSNLGANTILATSLACSRAAAAQQGIPLYTHIRNLVPVDERRLLSTPLPMANILNGGAHANNPLDIQECMIQPIGSTSFAESMRAIVEVFQNLKSILNQRSLSTAVGDEGGFAPDIGNTTEVLDLLLSAIEQAGYQPGKDIVLALDCASSEFFRDGSYHLSGEGLVLNRDEMVDWLANLCGRYPIASIEDGMAENDPQGWRLLNQKLGDTVQLVGDDLLVSNVAVIDEALVAGHNPNAILVKTNQVGSLSETLDTIIKAHGLGMATVISHRSGETEDSFIADLAAATGAGQIKTGACSRSDRNAKYNRLLWIEHESDAPFAGARYLHGKYNG